MSAGGLVDGGDLEADRIETRMGAHVGEIMAAARQAAAQLKAEVERASTERAAQIETAAARRAHELRMNAEAEAERLQTQARVVTQQYVAASRRLVDEFAKERMRRISEIGDRLGEQAEQLVERFARSDEIARQLTELRTELGAACERIAAEARCVSPQLPALPAGERAGEDAPEPRPAEDAIDVPKTPQERLDRASGRQRKRVTKVSQPPPGAQAGEYEKPDDGG
jgi:DNA repair exonuclease SbcCD ATPase subunit